MKQSKIIGIILTVINIILVIVCIVFYIKADRSAPKFEVQAADIVYREDMDNAELLKGITAYDSVDGDVTDRIVIEKIIENKGSDSMVVFYAVSDKAGNVAKFSKVFQTAFGAGMEMDEESKDEMAMRVKKAGIEAELEGSTDAAKTEDTAPSATPSFTAMPSPTPEKTPAQTQAPTETPPQEEEPQPEQKPKNTVNPEAPVLTLKVSEVKTAAGSAPAWVDVIGTLKDDKDNYETLFHNLSVSKYDKNKAGTYQVTVSTEDSDGNKSAEVPLTIVVK